MVADPIACYGTGLNELADTIGDVDIGSKDALRDWKVARWRATADAFEFREALEPALQAAIKSGEQFGSIDNVAANVWVAAMRQQRFDLPTDFPHAEVNQLRHTLLEDFRSKPTSLWRVAEDAVNLPGRACIGERRVFPSSNAPNYFDGGSSEEPTPRTCVWKSPVVLYLGTWPWYHGSSLVRGAPGLQWRDAGPTQPARQAIRVYSSAWSLEGNAVIDARDVYAQYEYFRRQTDPLVSGLGSKPKTPGSLYLGEGGFIHAYLTSAPKAYLNGPLGPVSVAAYNHVLRSVAAFFALRRAMIRGANKLPDNVRARLATNHDECASKHFKGQPSGNDKKSPGVIKG